MNKGLPRRVILDGLLLGTGTVPRELEAVPLALEAGTATLMATGEANLSSDLVLQSLCLWMLEQHLGLL